ncbi:MAPEG family protein [Pseudophaeobacter sp.]|uniref:MAPEG family protein n=1 Tax=Pseudophaeobacter sp. TaxID=1971739 RepID=UPI00405A42EA
MDIVVSDYSLALISLLVFVLIVLFQSALVGAAKAKAKVLPGGEPAADYSSSIYRLNRSHQNGVEIMPAAGIVLAAAILAGVSASVANGVMIFFLITRVLYVVVYAQSLGNPVQGLRTFAYVEGWAALIVLAVMAIWHLL